MSFTSWLRSRTSIRSLRTRAQHRSAPPRIRPQLEVLEGRVVPSTLTVTNNQDNGFGSLRAAINAANSDNNSRDTIVFAPNLGVITLTSGELIITKNLTIQGPATISGGDSFTTGGVAGGSRVFEVDGASTNVTLSGLTIEYGAGVAFAGGSHAGDGEGGGILNYGTLTLSGCTLANNTTNLFNGGYYLSLDGGAIYNVGTLNVSGCNLSNNSVGYVNGGGTGRGGAIYNSGTITVSNSTLAYNTAYGGDGGGIYGADKSTATITGSTLDQNSAYDGGGIWNDGSMTVSSCHMYFNNAANDGGGIFNNSHGHLTIQSSNISSNTDGANGVGADLYNLGQVKISSDSYVGVIHSS